MSRAKQIPFTGSDDVLQALSRLGRTEDVQFSPDGRRLAIAGMLENKILLLDIRMELAPEDGRVLLTDYLEVTSSAFDQPHGLFWIDDRTMIVANRNGELPIFVLPPEKPASRVAGVLPLSTIKSDPGQLVKTPGSVSVSRIGQGLHEVFVCNNYVHHVSRHVLDERSGFRLEGSSIFLRKGLDIPDGVASSHDGRWIAVSNHNDHSVFVYENVPGLDLSALHSGRLAGIAYPHGVRFAAGGKYLLVADAGAPFVHIFESSDGNWGGERQPTASVRLVDEETFLSGRHNEQEGGPKGIDMCHDSRVLVASCHEQPIAFMDMSEILKPAREAKDRNSASVYGADEVQAVRASLLRNLNCAASSEADARRELDATRVELEATRAELETTRVELEATRTGLEAARAELEATRAELEARPAEPETRAELGRELIKWGVISSS